MESNLGKQPWTPRCRYLEAFWASEPTSIVELPNAEDILAKMAYAIANPCSSHLVDRVHVWPGVESLTAIEEDLSLVASKPSRFFDRDNSDLPDVVQLGLHRRPGEPMLRPLGWSPSSHSSPYRLSTWARGRGIRS